MLFFSRFFYYLLVLILSLITLSSCVKQPVQPTETKISGNTGTYILCEGLWGYNNSSLARYDFATDNINKDYFSLANNGQSLGDLANDMIIKGDTAYIIMSSSKLIYKIDVKTGKKLGELSFPGKSQPRRMIIFNDTLAFVSDLYKNILYAINPQNLTFYNYTISTGPAPEAIAVYKNYIIVANSGYGDYLANEPKAGTISVIDINSRQEVNNFKNVPDVVELTLNSQTGKLYAGYYNLPSLKDSLGGIVEYDIETQKETRRWLLPDFDVTSFAFSPGNDTLFFINNKGVALIELNESNAQPVQFIKNPNKSEFWKGLAYNKLSNQLWIGNDKNYQVSGDILIYNIASQPKLVKKFPVGVNPNKILFF